LVVPRTETPAGPVGWSQALESNAGAARASSGRGHTTNGAILGAATIPATRRRSDEQLARAAGRGDARAFEALYERHHSALLSFSRHMLARPDEAEDVVQHAFAAADRAFRAGRVPRSVRAWLFTVARNRCVSLLRARREQASLPDAGVPSTENLAADVERRDDLRRLLADLRALPDDQRAALLLAELGELSHAEVAEVIGVRPGKVRALVFQARETLLAAASARAIPCRSIREELAVASGAELRRRHLRHHLAGCSGCREYAASVKAQRASLAVLLPVVPSVALREGVLAGLSGGAAATGAGAGVGVLAAKSTAAKLLTIAAVGGAAAGGGTVAVTAHDAGDRSSREAERRAEAAPAVPASAASDAPAATAALPIAPERSARSGRVERNRRAGVRTTPGHARRRDRPAPPGQAKQPENVPPGHARERPRAEPPGQAKKPAGRVPPGHAKKTAGRVPPGQAKKQVAKAPPGQAKQLPAAPKASKPQKSAKPADAGPAPPPAAAPAEQPLPPGQESKSKEGQTP
jgi:RNA polymerase sigma factor (sigma-70 family)